MTDMFFYGCGVIAAIAFGFILGRLAAREPREQWMFDRLVELRAARKITERTKDCLEREIQQQTQTCLNCGKPAVGTTCEKAEDPSDPRHRVMLGMT